MNIIFWEFEIDAWIKDFYQSILLKNISLRCF